jgi:hypothetical protein
MILIHCPDNADKQLSHHIKVSDFQVVILETLDKPLPLFLLGFTEEISAHSAE